MVAGLGAVGATGEAVETLLLFGGFVSFLGNRGRGRRVDVAAKFQAEVCLGCCSGCGGGGGGLGLIVGLDGCDAGLEGLETTRSVGSDSEVTSERWSNI